MVAIPTALVLLLLLWVGIRAIVPAIIWRMHISARDRRLQQDAFIVENPSLNPNAGTAQAELDRFASLGKPISMKFDDAVTGKPFDIAQVAGHSVLIDFWASWCGPCMGQMSRLREAVRRYGTKGLVVVGVSLDDSRKAMLDAVRREHMTWPELFDGKGWNSSFARSWGIYEIPAAFLVDGQGKLRNVDVNLNALDDEIDGLSKPAG